ncbi:MAG: ComEC/Rec2 family competence protein [Patescibacteria group bacterium]
MQRYIFAVVLLLCICRIGFAIHEHQTSTLPKLSSEVEVTVRLTDDVDLRDGWAQVASYSDTYGGLLLKLPRRGEYFIGDELVVRGALRQPRNFFSDNGKEFDYINFLAKDHIAYQMNVREIISQAHASSSWVRSLVSIKKWFIASVQNYLNEPYSSLAVGLVVGGKSSLGKEWSEAFRRAGLIHAVVLSGYNVSIVVSILLGCLKFLPRHARFVAGILGITAFAIMTGASTTIIRASVMAVIALYAEISYSNYSVLRALFLAALIMVVWNPLTLPYDPSFHLSFLATLGLILFSDMFTSLCKWVPLEGLRSIVSSTLAAQVLVTPYILYMMGEISILGIFANIVVTPVIPFTMLAVTLLGLSSLLPIFSITTVLTSTMTFVTHVFLAYIFKVVDIISSSKYATLSVPRFSTIAVIVSYVIIFAVYFLASRKFFSTTSQLTLEK